MLLQYLQNTFLQGGFKEEFKNLAEMLHLGPWALLQETLHLGASNRVADLSGLQSNNGGLVWSKKGRPKLPEGA